MKIETVKALANGTGALAGSSGMITIVMGYLKTNAVELGVLCSIISLFIYMFFQILYYRKLTLADENKIDIKKVEKKLDKHIIKTSSGINLIIDKIDEGK